MSKYTAISAVSSTLQTLLRQQISADPQLSLLINPQTSVSLRSPKAIREPGNPDSGADVSVWLYRVTRNEYTLNNRPDRSVANQVPRAFIPINLYYLITPMDEDPELQQTVLGKVLQAFNDHAILRGSDLLGSLQGTTEELRLSLEMPSLEELSQVWDALNEPYQLSVCYQVQVVTIESGLEPVQAQPVLVRNTTYAQILDSQ